MQLTVVGDQDGISEVAESVDSAPGKRAGKVRVKPRHLSKILRQCILDRFEACHSTEDVAEEMRLPVRTVTDVVLAALIRRSPLPDIRNGFMVTRRAA